jgi:hypothetical protein
MERPNNTPEPSGQSVPNEEAFEYILTNWWSDEEITLARRLKPPASVSRPAEASAPLQIRVPSNKATSFLHSVLQAMRPRVSILPKI